MNKIRNQTCYLGVLTFLTLLLTCSLCYSQATILPRLLEVRVARGGTSKFQLRIANRGTTVTNFKISVYDLEVSEEGVPTPIFTTTDSSCCRWVSVSPPEFTLEPDEAQVVEGLVRAPRTAMGGYGAIIYAEYKLENDKASKTFEGKTFSLDLGRAVAATLVININSSQNFVKLVPDSLHFEIISPEKRAEFSNLVDTKDRKWEISFPVKNDGNAVAMAAGNLSIWDKNAHLIERVELKAGKGYIFPNQKRIFHAYGEKTLRDGSYLVKSIIRSREGKTLSGTTPYSIIAGKPIPGQASPEIYALMAASQPTFTLSEPFLDFTIEPGASRVRGLQLSNLTNDTLKLIPQKINWQIDSDNRIDLLIDNKNVKRSCASWLEITPEVITVPPKGTISVKIAINSPDTMRGEYYSAVYFKSANQSGEIPEEFILEKSLFLSASSKRFSQYAAKIDTVTVQNVSSMMHVANVTITNTGNIRCYAQGEISILDVFGTNLSGDVDFGGDKEFIFPDSKRTFSIPIEKELTPGTYRINVNATYAEKETKLKADVKFQCKDK